MTVENNRLATMLGQGQTLLGLYHGYSCEAILETIAPGWDFVWIDGQHGQFSIDGALRAVRVASLLGLETVLRVATHDPGVLAQHADTGASAIMVPQVETVAAARAVARALRFPPRGDRSFGGRRAIDVHGRDYYRTGEPLVIVQIESREGMERAEPIAAIDGIDGLFFSPDDLKLSFGLPIETPVGENGALLEARQETARAAQAAGKWCGCPGMELSEVPKIIELGYQMLIGGADVKFLRAGAQKALAEFRGALVQVGGNFAANREPPAGQPSAPRDPRSIY
jgi:4-hydroxy-2-oxoheptanedioate aldolase